MTLLSGFLLSSLLIGLVAAENDDLTCQPGMEPIPLPKLPQQFSVSIEASIGGRNTTVIISEYYDGIGQRGRIDASQNFQDPQVFREGSLIADYASDQSFYIQYMDSKAVNCMVVPLENDRFINFTFHEYPGPNGTVRIGSVNDIFMFGDMINLTYIGQEFVRGILCDRWQYCFQSPNVTYRTEYYFSVEGWAHPNNGSRVPVIITVNGLNRDGDSNRTVKNTYTFTSFNPNPPRDELLSVPQGVICKNRKQLKKFPLLNPDYFSIISEYNIGNQTNYYPVFYDRKANLARFDFMLNRVMMRPIPPLKATVIHDFVQGVQYFVNRTSGSCNVSAISGGNFFPDVHIDENGHAVLSSFLELISSFTNGSDSYIYEGESVVRGIQADVWIAFTDQFKYMASNFSFVNITMELYFTKELVSLNGQKPMPIPLRERISGIVMNGSNIVRSVDAVVELFNFNMEEPAYEVFDAYVCFKPSSTKEVTFTLPGVAMGTDLSGLRGNIRAAFSQATSAPASQFGNIQIQTYSEDTILVTLLLLDPPPAAASPGPSSQQLYDMIASALKRGSLSVTVNGNSAAAVPQSFQQTPTPSSPANVVGIGVGCFLGGLAAGVLITVIIVIVVVVVLKFTKKKQDSYYPQKDDI
jgi:hypothetical protein